MVTTPALSDAARLALSGSDGTRLLVTAGEAYEGLLKSETMVPIQLEGADDAWIFYTSGTTGRPKGAVLTHRNLLFMSLTYYADIDKLGPEDTHLHTAPLSHGSGLYALPHLLKGSHQVIFPGFDIPRMEAALERYDHVTMFAVPTMLTRLVAAWRNTSVPIDRIKTIYYGGAPMYVADLEEAIELFGPRLYQLFGQGESPMTITGLDQAFHSKEPSKQRARLLASCGYPRTGVAVRVVDGDDRDMPSGTVGEVIAQSDCMMKGYWNNPEANEKTLRNGWLHTGDLGALDDDGLLHLTDRSKDLIISGGTNIYPREIEEVLLTHLDVVETAVIGAADREWGEQVVAFVVRKTGASVQEKDLDRLCLDQLARFKRPKRYEFIDSLPKSGYGKILKTELRKMLSEERERA